MKPAVGRPAASIALLGLAALLGGCGPEVAPSPAATPTDIPLPTPVTTAYVPAATAWYAGLVIHVDAVSAVLRAGTGTATVQLRIENPGSAVASLEAPLRLTSNGQVALPVRGTELPDVEAGGSAAASVAFDITPGFDLATATFRIGRTSEHQVVVPLVAGAADLVANMPTALAFSGAKATAAAGSLRLTLASGELRADLPDWGLELPARSLALTLTYDVRYLGTFAGGLAFTAANIGLSLPNGTVVGPRTDGQSQSTVLLVPGVVAHGLSSRFEVPIPGPGRYALVIRDGKASASIAVVIAAASPSD